MLPIVKDLLNYKNYIKALKEPKKIINFFNRFNYYPGIKFAYSKSKFYKILEIKLTTFFAKKMNSEHYAHKSKNRGFSHFFL